MTVFRDRCHQLVRQHSANYVEVCATLEAVVDDSYEAGYNTGYRAASYARFQTGFAHGLEDGREDLSGDKPPRALILPGGLRPPKYIVDPRAPLKY